MERPFLQAFSAGQGVGILRLLYLYTKFYDVQGSPSLYRGFPFWSINFSADRHFNFTPETGELSEPQGSQFIPEVPRGFWGERIYNATAFVSNNGGGKSTIMQYMILLLADLEQNLPSPKRIAEDWVIVFGIDDRTTIALQNKSLLAKTPCATIHSSGKVICSGCGQQNDPAVSRVQQYLRRTKLLYLSNVLGKTDQMFQAGWLTRSADRTKRFLFDASTCAMMHQAEQDSLTAGDVQQMFFTQEQERMFHFLTSPEQISLLRKLRQMNYPVPVPRLLTVYINTMYVPESMYHWECLAFPQSWGNIRASQDHTPTLQVERIIFDLCCGVVAGCLKQFYHSDFPEVWSSLFGKLDPAEASSESGDDTGCVVCEEFLDLLDKLRTLLPKEHSSSKQVHKAVQREIETALSWHIRLCQDFIRFLCSQRSRTALAQYLPTADPIEQRFMQLGEQVRSKFIVALDTVLLEDAQDGQPAWFITFYQQYLKVCGSTPYLTLDWGLSSGEENLLKMFTNLWEVCCPAGHGKKIICNAKGRVDDGVCQCITVWLFLDEADLTYHPEWQRQFMATLTAFLREVYPLEMCREMQIFLSTHSPLMLGDFPSRCTAYLRRHEDGTRYVDDSGRVDTFGENLFALLHSGFYLQNGEVGEIAKQKVQTVIDFLTKTQEKLETGELEDAADACRELQRHQDETVALLADGPIKAKLRLDLKRLEDQLISNTNSRDSLIQALEAKLRHLKGEEEPV